MSRIRFQSSDTAAAAGVVLFAAGWWCFHQAYEGRGRDTPFWLRPFTWW